MLLGLLVSRLNSSTERNNDLPKENARVDTMRRQPGGQDSWLSFLPWPSHAKLARVHRAYFALAIDLQRDPT